MARDKLQEIFFIAFAKIVQNLLVCVSDDGVSEKLAKEFNIKFKLETVASASDILYESNVALIRL